MIREFHIAGLLIAVSALSACVWDDGGPRVRGGCEAELQACTEACDDVVARRQTNELDPLVNDPLTCEARCHDRFQRCLERTRPADDNEDED